MIEDKSVLDLQYKTVVDNDDSVVADVGSVVSRVKISTLKGLLGQWNDISNKPFTTLDTSYLVNDNSQLSLSTDVKNKLHTHSNKTYLDKISENSSGQFTYNGSVVGGYITDDVIADQFDENTSYNYGDYVMYANKLYKCTTAHTGTWDANNFELTDIIQCIEDSSLGTVVNAPSAQDIADSITTIWGN